MAYLGQGPFQEFTNPPTKDSFTGDGSTTAFDMSAEVASSAQNALEVYVDNVRQEPGTGKAFTLGPDGSNDTKRITFSAAPANGASIYVINDKTNISVTAPLNNDLNGTELILDGDGDTSITADTDDRIDFRLAAADHFHIGTSSGDTVFQNRTDAKDFLFNQYDGRTILEINDAGYVAIANGATGPGQLRIYEDTDLGTNFTAFQVGTQAADITYTLPTADGSSGQLLTTNGSGVLSFSSVSSAADDLTIGDAAVLLTTSAGNITIDAAGNDTDIIFKGTDGGADRVFMTIDGSAGGDLFLTGGLIDLKNDGSAVSQIKFYCESSNAHAQTLIGAPHSESATNTLTLPDGSNGVLLSTVSTATVTNKTFTSPKLNEDVAVTTTATELNLIDGGATVGTTAIADGDGLLINDAGTMRVSTVQTLAAYLDDEITAMPNLVTTAATTVGVLGSGSIAAGFGNIDNGASNITSGGLVSLDVDADADDVSGDSATGRLTLGAGQDLNLYHGGTNSYIVNDTGDLILKTGASDEDMIFQGNDGGSPVTALTLDMSAAGAATFNSTVAATGFIIGSANIGEAELEILDGLAATTAELTVIDGDTSATGTTVADADRVVMNDNGTMVQVAVTDLAAYFDDEITAMPNLTSVGTLTALTVDDVAVDGKVITMTGSSGDTFVTTVAANGATSLVTTDASAAAANLQITADGTVDIDSAGVLTLDSGAAINIEPAAGSAILLDGTISIDAGVVTGATSITSTAFVGALTGAASSNLLKAGGTMTGDLILGDNVKLEIGSASGGDLQIYHDASNSYIDEAGTGSLIIRADGAIQFKKAGTSEYMARFDADGASTLYHNNAAKIATSAVGITVTGTAIATTDTDTSNTGNVTLDFAANQNFVLTLTGATTLVNPTTEQVGQSGFIVCVQDGTGSRTLSVGNQFFTPGGVGVTLSTAVNSIDIVPYVVQAAGKILLGTPQLAFADAS